MKKSILIMTLIFAGLFSIAQNTYNLVLFSEDGEPFFAYVNGIRQNDKAETNIKVTGLNSAAISVRVQFEKAGLPILKQNMAPEPGFEHTVRIKQNVKKVMKMQYFGKVALEEAPRTNAATVQYHTAETPLEAVNVEEPKNNSINESSNINVTTTSTTVNTSAHPANSTVTMNVGEIGINMNVNVPASTGTTAPVYHSTTSSTVITTTSTSTTTSVNNPHSSHPPKRSNTKPVNDKSTITVVDPASSTITPRPINPALTTTVVSVSSSVTPRPMDPALNTTSAVPATNVGCGTPMNEEAYEKLKTSIDEKPFQDNKMSIAKVGTKSNCLTVAQIKGICELFAMDDHKLTYAKYAYTYCTDKQNYYQVSEAFTFPRTTENLNKFLQQQK